MPSPSLESLLEMLDSFHDRSDRIQFLIDLADSFLPTSRPRPYEESHRVPGCESEVFLWVNRLGSVYETDVAVENPQGVSAMAMAALLQQVLPELNADEIKALPEDLVYRVFGSELSMGKSLGLVNMLKFTKHLAARQG